MSNRSRRRRRLSRLEKLLRGSLSLSKYPLPGVFIALAGCVPPTQFIAISPDGRYAVVPFNDAGPSLISDMNGRLLRIDLQTLEAVPIGPEAAAHVWLDAAGSTIVTHTQGDSNAGLAVRFEDKATIFKDLAFPALSPDGKTLYATRGAAFDLEAQPEEAVGPLVAVDLATGKQQDLGIHGFAGSVSPDGKHLAYIGPAADTDADGKAWSIYALPIAKQADPAPRSLANFNPDHPWNFKPRWIDDQTLIYRGYAPGSPEDTDLYTVSLDGKHQQLTADNTISEAYPQPASGGRLVWLAVKGQVLDFEDKHDPISSIRGKLVIASPDQDGQYTVKQLRYAACAFAVHGDTLLFVDYDMQTQRPSLWMLDLKDPQSAAVNLSDDILREVQGLPQAGRTDDFNF